MKILIGLVVLALVLGQHGVQGERSTIFEDMNLEEQLMILNKPSIKTFHTEEGDIFDCVDIYKQPALDHPLLKNHKIQMRPTSLPEGLINEPASIATSSLSNGVDCPQGTVPIRRTQKEDLLRVKSFSDEYQLTKNIHPHTTIFPNQHMVSLAPNYLWALYYGARASISVHHLDINNDQYTTAQMWLGRRPIDQYSIQAGWMIGSKITGDNLTRSFVYWTKDQSKKTGCFNQLCPGFVQVHKQVTIGSVLKEISVYGEAQKSMDLSVFRDRNTGHWWLQLNGAINVGYLPKTLIPQLVEGLSDIAWGGLAVNPPNGHSPPMGNGHFPKGNFTTAASFTAVKIVDSTNTYRIPDDIDVKFLVENRACYNIEFHGKYLNEGLAFLYGGPGGDCKD
ncbi:Nep-interacting protein [Thalictrum thalictroides]|uniref:Nep-interacting protein n=1 Tax=Thalictrum thalictroides TaxID=46969 RepID=A0A7J6WNA7_THATH|nr:Nep-interacting protein [Thalictrum thalictroides]